MSRQFSYSWALLILAAIVAIGCHPTQPTYFFDDGDLSHYLDVATDIEYPDVAEEPIDEVTGAEAPLTLENASARTDWDLSLEEVIRITLTNRYRLTICSKCMDVAGHLVFFQPERGIKFFELFDFLRFNFSICMSYGNQNVTNCSFCSIAYVRKLGF